MKPYDPQMTCYPYPNKTDAHYLVVKKDDKTVFDENYPYVDYSKRYKFLHSLMRIVTVLVAFPINRIRCLLTVKGKDNLKKYKDVLSKGCVSVVNHMYMWDFIGIMDAIRPFQPFIPVWDKNMRGENKTLIRYNNGIPLPTQDFRATYSFSKAIDKLLTDGNWVHFSAEGSMWEYYQPIRPFKKGAFTFAVRNNKPVLPLAYSYRKPKGLLKLFWHKPLLTLNIGVPIFPDMTLSKAECAEKLQILAHEQVCKLAGINPKDNIYPPIFNNNDRIDYYSCVYGVKK